MKNHVVNSIRQACRVDGAMLMRYHQVAMACLNYWS